MTRYQNHDDDDDDDASSSSSSRKRFKTFDNGDEAPWSDLHRDVLFLVMMQMGVIDFVAFSGVCKSWRSFALSKWNKFMACKPPMSITTSLKPNESVYPEYCYLEDFEGREFKTILPHLAGRKCVGSTCGYLILFGRKTHDFLLLNPITRHELYFPDYPFYSGVSGIRGILVFSPSVSQWVFVVLHIKMSLYIVGKQGWHLVCSTPLFLDLHAFKGKIYTIDTKFCVCELKLHLNQKQKWSLTKTKELPNLIMFRPLIVSSAENLYVIIGHKVWEVDIGEMKWVSPEKTIGKYALFRCGRSYSAAIKPESWIGPRTHYKSYDHFSESRPHVFTYCKDMWYFPHDCLNVNLLDEQ